MEKQKKAKSKKTLTREILEWVLTIVVAVVIALPIRAFGFELVRVDGESMDNTLANGEIMFVTKYDYASTWLCFPWQDAESKEKAARITTGGNPQRFDVVICRYPGRGDTNFVKRVVGLPGDTIEIRDGYLYVNGDRYEIGRVVSTHPDGAFVCYHEGETAAKTPYECMHRLENQYVMTSLGGDRFADCRQEG